MNAAVRDPYPQRPSIGVAYNLIMGGADAGLPRDAAWRACVAAKMYQRVLDMGEI